MQRVSVCWLTCILFICIFIYLYIDDLHIKRKKKKKKRKKDLAAGDEEDGEDEEQETEQVVELHAAQRSSA